MKTATVNNERKASQCLAFYAFMRGQSQTCLDTKVCFFLFLLAFTFELAVICNRIKPTILYI